MKKREWNGPVNPKQTKRKKSGKKKKVICISMAAILVVSGGVWYWQRGKTQVPVISRSVSEVQVMQSDVANTIVGTGNLTTDVTDSLTIPSGLTIDAVKVESGDTVKKGDVLATVNHLSVLQRIVEVQKEISQLEDDIEAAEDDEDVTDEETALWEAQKLVVEAYGRRKRGTPIDLSASAVGRAKKKGAAGIRKSGIVTSYAS